jgi:hypothetical protein
MQDRRTPGAEDIARWQEAQKRLQRAWADLQLELGDDVPVQVQIHGYQLARAVIRWDDGAGERGGWVTRGDGVKWSDVIALGRAAVAALDPEHRGQHPVGCAACEVHLAVGRLRERAPRGGTPGAS